jgi:hypothetical protein
MFTDTQVDSERASRLLENIENDLRTLRQIMLGDAPRVSGGTPFYYNPTVAPSEDTAIEGFFDGEKMVDGEGKGYQVSANYASKSKLVEGDPLKLYITGDGKFFYKQLGPVERKTVPGVLRAEGSKYVVDGDDAHTYNVLTASVTYYMSLYGVHAGDRLMMLLPADRQASWAVIENVL